MMAEKATRLGPVEGEEHKQRTFKAMKNVILQRYNEMILRKKDVQVGKQTQKILRKAIHGDKPLSKADLERLQVAYSMDMQKQ